MSLLRLGGVLQPALARTTSAIASTRQEAASLVSVLFLNPGAMIALVFGLWRLGVDLGWAGNFVVSEGLFSHWLVWILLSGGLKALAMMATRDAKREDIEQPAGPERT
jgi:hypothetical protein